MAFKINLSDKGKTFKIEVESESLVGKKIGDKISGKEFLPALANFEFEIRGTSDKAGFPGKVDEEGPGLRKSMFVKGKFMKKTPAKGFRRKKNVRGNEISGDTVQINCSLVKGENLEKALGKEEAKEAEASEENKEEKKE